MPKELHDPIASRLGYLLRRASATMMADLGEALGAVGLRPVEGTILILVGANPGCIQSELGRALGIKRANMVPLIAGLTAQNYLEKSPVDGRSFALSLTPRGEEARARVDGIMDAHEAGFARLLADVDQQQLRAALSLIASGRD
ncbi:MarR family winged helix-turn-helix transcriptional regulator [Sphingobium naphthae]|uniref:MarR family winged helix-turn-helix transcriptional regulator n=1 Tax=Sphingobium naphthae TaxID=1886786 RepID=A0ABU3ZZL3_9SPHN|nr:MarR family winged helix-turn-helix transcriptional regulator [Sphingobium naphthae]MCC4251295.1 MarR family winged helix-turn-helix transcriptional regulator [Sphingobium naphthae]MDV5824976.1 MarR family winged helix-turn-helix transcriptional regulator [Sphingobium naphthae]